MWFFGNFKSFVSSVRGKLQKSLVSWDQTGGEVPSEGGGAAEKAPGKMPGYMCPVLITLVLYCIILFTKHIFPFGDKTIDYYDLSQQIAPLYYHIHDMLHGKTSFFFNFYSALGLNMSVVTSGCSGLSPFNLFFLLVPRDYLLESLSFFQLIKILGMTLTMYFYLTKRFRAPYFFNVFLSVNYAFCGFVLMLYMENKWMDIAVFFPLIMYFYDRMMHGGRITGYVLTLALSVISSFYLGFVIILFIFLYTGLRILADRLYAPKEKRTRTYMLELGFSTGLSLLLSSFIVIPQLRQILASSRFANGNSGSGNLIEKYIEIIRQTNPAYTTRWWTLFNIAFASAVIFTGLIRVWKNRRLRFFSISLIILMTAELFVEGINLCWHFGSYIQYPIRNGFIINFCFAMLACMYAERMFDEKPDKHAIYGLVISGILFAAFVFLYGRHPGMELRSVFHITALMMLLSFTGYVVIFFWDNGAHYTLTLMILCTELLCYGFLMYGKPAFVTGYAEEPEQENDYISICRQLRKEFELPEGRLYRIKNPDESLNANYSLVLETPALSNWTHIIPGSLQKSASEWGYSIQFTRILDAGGTAFTDALIGIRDVISCVPQDEELYKKVASAEIVVDADTGETMEYTWYKCRYFLPFGVVLYSNAMFDSELENRNPVSLQNQMYRALTGADNEYEQEISVFKVRNGQLIDEDSSLTVTEVSPTVKRYLINAQVRGKKTLYFNSSTTDMEDKNITVTVSDDRGLREIPVPSIKEPLNLSYPAHFNNNVICLGTYEDETVTVTVDVDTEKGPDYPVNLFELDLDRLKALCDSYAAYNEPALELVEQTGEAAQETGEYSSHIKAGKRSIAFKASVSEAAGSTVMLLPIAFDEGWSLKVNGKKSDILYSYGGLFTAVPLYTGENKYEMSFFPSGMGLGIVLSLVAASVLGAIIVIRKRRITVVERELEVMSRDTEKWLTPAYLVLWGILVILMYMIPAGAFLVL